MGDEEITGGQVDASLIEEIPYDADRSPDFDALVDSREHTNAPQDGLSKQTKDKVLVSGWQVPCHCIVVRTKDGLCQAFHVQPNKAGSFLTVDQENALKELGQQGASAIVVQGKRGWFAKSDIRELERFKIGFEREIRVDTPSWWRLLYDPRSNEIWIDRKVEQKLTKYHGFDNTADKSATGISLTRRPQPIAQ